MKVIFINEEKRDLTEYIEAVRKVDESAMVRGFHVADMYRRIVAKEIANLSYPVLVEDKRIHVKTFGNFEVFIDGVPITSKYNKTRELFAFLIDKNGALADLHEIETALWEGDTGDHISYLKNIRSDMINTLRSFGVEDVVIRQRGRIGIIPDTIESDYFDMLAGKDFAIRNYNGEYMCQYSWAEFTNGILMGIKEEYMTHQGDKN
ncbi:MAG: hypothetical protein K6B14_04020 [Lachnospiraceae bacterium]|nr:hypothetical protein [Lachnospiraceae bacterium]